MTNGKSPRSKGKESKIVLQVSLPLVFFSSKSTVRTIFLYTYTEEARKLPKDTFQLTGMKLIGLTVWLNSVNFQPNFVRYMLALLKK